jgi:hypothetical protein
MNTTIFGQKIGGKRKRVEDEDSAEEFFEDFEEEDDVDDGDDDWLDEESDKEADTCAGDVYDVSSVVDLTALVLRDLISDRAINGVKASCRPAVVVQKVPDGPVTWNFSLD